MQDTCSVVIIGAGPAGLTSAHQLVKQGIQPIVLEQADRVGGISRTETYKGYRFDIGGHRFYTKVGEIQQIWIEILGNNFLKVPRLSRIYYNGNFFNYPLELSNALSNLGIVNSFLMLFSYFQAKILPHPVEESFEEWVCNRFGKRLYQTFFKTYTEKVWGIPCTEIRADWAAQRIQGMSLKKAIVDSLVKNNQTKSLIKEFYYPELGPGMMWEKCQEIITNKGGTVHLDTKVNQIYHQDNRIQKITVQQESKTFDLQADYFISSMPVTALILRLYPPAPAPVLQAARSLKYRDFLIVALIIDHADLFPDNWIYIHSPEFKVGRIQNFKNWSPAMVPDSSKTCLGMEYFCSEGDEIWSMSDNDLIKLASQEIVALSLLSKINKSEDATVIRQKKAYPIYDQEYRQHLQVIQDYLKIFDNLQTIGRNGMYRYNNQDHSMLTGLLAAKNILGENHNLWEVNTEHSYYEDFTKQNLS
ncbi:NAD(P)/FAD-dependent oxidoreductase [Nodularia sphaerocarpa]|uniref:NAD(P)/FAD-dependent oxidoreductase n=1 Tax=Nodularia sphaerocarpa TaxID=137816 RepID=UPI001EFAAAFC|nr:NAD(P)/FAD-dependent oxidoreductase [Nodularia sphaerocarpa]MDB9372528.1 NAD(P)/FAD-dependent oxidoreductase [Nodularia sphaerocarpa CS-585]MDB9376922.1 NAD(P)/FAD-dependent oxidoreductase [Nodularia sphaerocarpa CS-585A2]ULP73660.1 UDP-galactopyranose mutase [Nodularia sphaerocarpa UHCC 0038]